MQTNRQTEQELLLQVKKLEQQQEDVQQCMKTITRQLEEDEAHCRNQYLLTERLHERYESEPRIQQAVSDKQAILTVMQKERLEQLETVKKEGNLQVKKLGFEMEDSYQALHQLKMEET